MGRTGEQENGGPLPLKRVQPSLSPCKLLLGRRIGPRLLEFLLSQENREIKTFL